jgi:hypothetical protein
MRTPDEWQRHCLTPLVLISNLPGSEPKANIMKRLFLLLTIPLLLTSCGLFPANMAGDWDLVMTDSSGATLALDTTIYQSSGDISGTITDGYGSYSFTGRVSGSTFELDANGGYVHFKGSISAGKLEGTWSNNAGDSGTFRAFRK